MIFSCLFDAFSSNECGRVFVYRKDGTRFDRAHIQMIHNSGRKSVPVWAWFSADGGGDFVRINGRFNKEKYLEILQNVLLPSIIQRFPDGRVNFIHDNSPIHTARVIKSWFQEHPEILVLPWPPKGADMNSIENVWGDMVQEMESYKADSAEEVFERASAVWEGFKQRPEYWRKLASSMSRRLALVVQAQGYWTKY